MMEVATVIHDLEKIHQVIAEVHRALQKLEAENEDRTPYMAHALGMALELHEQKLDQLQQELGIAV
jgi:chaperonin cofactor prefoldin